MDVRSRMARLSCVLRNVPTLRPGIAPRVAGHARSGPLTGQLAQHAVRNDLELDL